MWVSLLSWFRLCYHMSCIVYARRENSAKRVPLQNPLQLADIHKVHMMCAHKRIWNSKGPVPPMVWNYGRRVGQRLPPSPPSDIKYATSWVWTKYLIGSTPLPFFGDDACGFLFLFLLSQRVGIDSQFNLVWPREKTMAPSPCGFSMGYSNLKKPKIARFRISPYRLLKTEKTLPKESPCKIPSSWQKFTKCTWCAHTKGYEIAEDRSPLWYEIMGGGSAPCDTSPLPPPLI